MISGYFSIFFFILAILLVKGSLMNVYLSVASICIGLFMITMDPMWLIFGIIPVVVKFIATKVIKKVPFI